MKKHQPKSQGFEARNNKALQYKLVKGTYIINHIMHTVCSIFCETK